MIWGWWLISWYSHYDINPDDSDYDDDKNDVLNYHNLNNYDLFKLKIPSMHYIIQSYYLSSSSSSFHNKW
jgi:hypothetical protein